MEIYLYEESDCFEVCKSKGEECIKELEGRGGS